jgi:hypothetical protein
VSRFWVQTHIPQPANRSNRVCASLTAGATGETTAVYLVPMQVPMQVPPQVPTQVPTQE